MAILIFFPRRANKADARGRFLASPQISMFLHYFPCLCVWRREGLKDGDKSGARPLLAFGLIPEGVVANSVSFPDIPGLYSSAAALVRTQVAALHENEGERLTVERARGRERSCHLHPQTILGWKLVCSFFWGVFCSRAFTKLAGGELKFCARAKRLVSCKRLRLWKRRSSSNLQWEKAEWIGDKKASPVISC